MDANFVPNTVDKSFFWTSLLSFTAFWCVFLVLNIISISIYSVIKEINYYLNIAKKPFIFNKFYIFKLKLQI